MHTGSGVREDNRVLHHAGNCIHTCHQELHREDIQGRGLQGQYGGGGGEVDLGLKCGGGMMIDKMIYVQIDANKPSALKNLGLPDFQLEIPRALPVVLFEFCFFC